jgi:hypothetical protein
MSRSPYNLYPLASSGKELDLRTEFYSLLYGSTGEIAKGRIGLLRHMRRDSEGNRIPCPCRDRNSNEPDRDYYCRSCLGFGWFWDEVKIVYYRDDSSFREVDGENKEFKGDVFYVEYDVTVSSDDYIVTLKLDVDGNIQTPVERDVYFRILSAPVFRSDNGRIEFIAIRAIEERKWSSWYGVKLRNG